MIWACFSEHHKSDIVFVSMRLNSSACVSLLNEHLSLFLASDEQPGLIFQQDNAPCHRALNTRRWLQDRNIATMDWPSRSPDLNPIENLWGILVRAVYASGRQFSTIAELKAAIKAAWDAVDPAVLKKLINSMKNRMFELSRAQGGSINY